LSVIDTRSEDALVAEGLDTPRARSKFAISVRERRALLAITDFVVGTLGCVIAYEVVSHPNMRTFPVFDPILYGAVWVVGLFVVDGYGFQIPSSRWQSAVAVVKATPFALLGGVIAFFIQPYVMTRPLIVVSTLIGAGLLIVTRTTAVRVLLHESLAVRAVLLGRSEPNSQVAETLQAAKYECKVVARVIGPVDTESQRSRVIEAIRQLFANHAADELIVTSNDLRVVPGLVEECVTHGVRVVTASSLVERYMAIVPVDSIDTNWYLSLPDNDLWERPYAVARRIIDLVLSIAISIPFLILLPLLALLIRLDSRGPVMHVQRRVGQHGREFNLLKLRTMHVNAETSGPQLTAPGDPRITGVGRVLRVTRLDEVPQLLNIARGEMSFIGPRPERPELIRQLEEAIPRFSARLLVKPGLTGWAQVRGGYASTVPEMTRKLEYDLYYIKNRSFRLDLQILASTFVAVVGLSGR
jgi:exopolysaccharide biosynthesis polyprenyl glycosylphosphotransferase